MVARISRGKANSYHIPPTPQKTTKKTFRKTLKYTEGSLKIAAKATSVARSIGGIVSSFRDISDSANKGLKVTKGVSIALTPINIYNAANDTVDIVKKEKLKDKIWAIFSLLTNLDSIMDSAAATCGLVYTFAATSSKVIDWIPIYSIVSFFVGFISLGMAAESVAKSGKLVQELRDVLKQLDAASNDVDKAKILGDFLAKLEAEGVRPLFKKLMISKKAKMEGILVEDRIKDLARFCLNTAPRLQEAETIVRTLAGRAKIDLGFKVADIANRVIATVGKGLAIVLPVLPVSYIILAATGVFSLVMLGSKLLFISKNPFDAKDPLSRTRAEEFVGYISNGISHLRSRLHTIALWPQAHPATA